MSPVQRVTNVVLGRGADPHRLGLMGYSTAACRPDQREEAHLDHGRLHSAFQPFGPIIYFIFGRKRGGHATGHIGQELTKAHKPLPPPGGRGISRGRVCRRYG